MTKTGISTRRTPHATAAAIVAVGAMLAAAAAGAQPARKSAADVSAIAVEIYHRVNAERAAHGLPALPWNHRIAQSAVEHSYDMAVRNYFEHADPEGRDAGDRLRSEVDRCRGGAMVGENIYLMTDPSWTHEEVARKAVAGWMRSPGHRQRILDTWWDATGTGAVDAGARFYVTQKFLGCHRRARRSR